MARVDDRGQLLLIGAVFLGVLLVVLATILNAAIYTGALATSDDADGRAAVEYHHDVERAAETVLADVNSRNDTSYEALHSNASRGIADWSDLASRHHAVDHAAANATLANVTNGTRIVQADTARNFTNRSGAADWTLAGSVTDAREYRMNVSRSGLYAVDNETCGPSGPCYYAEVDDGSDTWRMYVYTTVNDTDITVEVVDATGDTGVCSTSAESAWINLTEGTVAGEDCAALSFAEGISGSYEISYANADNVTGSYELVVDTVVSQDPHYDATGSPTVSPVIYAATVRLTYRTPEIYYRAEVRVTPGDGDE